MSATETCVICGETAAISHLTSSDHQFGVVPGVFHLVECKACGLVRLSPRPTPEQIAGFYAKDYWFSGGDSTAGRLAELYRRIVLTDHLRFADLVLRESRPDGIVLDVGCGSGLFPRMMRARGYNAQGLDFSEEAARVARERNGVDVIVGDFLTAPIPPASCALITMYHVVEHLHDPAAYLRRARELLAPNGRLIIQVPDRDCWEVVLVGHNWTGYDVPRHIHVFRTRDIERLLDLNGFAVVREKHFSLRDHPAGLAAGIAPWLEPVMRGVRGLDANAFSALLKDLVFLALTVAVLPLTWLEGLLGKGSSVMVEAKLK